MSLKRLEGLDWESIGLIGPPGAQGPQGGQGPQGPQGEQGTAIKFSAVVPAGAGPTAIVHGLGVPNLGGVIVKRISTGAIVGVGISETDSNTVTLDFGTYVPAANEFRVSVIA